MKLRHAVIVSALLSICAAPAWSADYYVRYGASGTGSSWADAFGSIQAALNAVNLSANVALEADTIYVEASSGANYYAPAGHTGSIQQPFDLTFSGGWENVDVSPTQTGTSLIKGSGLTSGDKGLHIQKTSGQHSESGKYNVQNFSITDVSVGLSLYGSYDSFRPQINATNVSITAGTDGVDIYYNKNYFTHGPTGGAFTNVTIAAGQDGSSTGDGIKVYGPRINVTITDSSITSATGNGVYLQHLAGSGGSSSGDNPFVAITNSDLSNSAGDGLHYHDVNAIQWYNKSLDVTLDKARIEGNGGDGVDVMTYSNSDWTGGNNTGEIHFNMTNSLVVENGENGLKLVGFSDSRNDTTQVEVDILNSTIADNGGDGLFTDTAHATGGTHEIRNTIFSGNTGDGIDVTDGDDTGMTVTEDHNDFYGNGGTNLLVHAGSVALDATDGTVDPQFVGAGDDPYQLSSGSPLLDAGDGSDYPADDILGVSRPQTSNFGPYPSIGAYELEGAAVPEPATLALLAIGGAGLAAVRRRHN